MDCRDRIEGTSVERRKLLEKRMEMIASLMNQINEGESQKQVNQAEKMRKRYNDCYSIQLID